MPEKNLTGSSSGVVLEKVDITSYTGDKGEIVYHDGTGSREAGAYVYDGSLWIKTNAFS